jgi:hypothetical protein
MTALAAFLIYPVDEPTLFGESLNLAEELTWQWSIGHLCPRCKQLDNSTLTDPLAGFSVVQIVR